MRPHGGSLDRGRQGNPAGHNNPLSRSGPGWSPAGAERQRRTAQPLTSLGGGGYPGPVFRLGNGLDKFLERDQDRALFNLPPRPRPEA